MVLVEYHNKEIEELVAYGTSSLYRMFSGKKTFVKSLRAFVHLLKVIRDISDLEKFHYLQYNKGEECSSVVIEGSKLEGLLTFCEHHSGRTITITELKYTKQKGL
jgi:predicted transcriptional regulator